MTRNNDSPTVRKVTYSAPTIDGRRSVTAKNTTWNDEVARLYAAHDLDLDELPGDVADIEIHDVEVVGEMTPAEFNRDVWDILADTGMGEVADWSVQNATDMGGLSPADVAREQGLLLVEDSLDEVLDIVETGYEAYRESVEELRSEGA